MRNIALKRLALGLAGICVLVPTGIILQHYQADMEKAYQRTSGGGKVIETACGPVEYAEFGEGAPVLIVHGSGGGYDQGIFFARLIGGNFRWIAPSRFGYLNTPVPEGASSSMQADTHACLLDALGIEKVAVVGISLGGPSALLFAQRYPQRITSLVMANAVSHLIPPRPAVQSLVFKAFLSDFVYWSIVHTSKEGLLSLLGVPAAFQKELPPEQLDRAYAFLEDMMPMGARKNGQLLEAHMSEFDADQIRDIQAPTLVLHARDDTLVPFEHGILSVEKIPGAQMIALEKGGHLAFLFEQNAWARQKAMEFLEQYNSR